MTVLNLTPHPLKVLGEDGEPMLELPKAEAPARVSASTRRVGEVDGIPVYQEILGEVENLPEPREGAYYVVSRMIAAACPGRHDLLVPGNLIRDGEGRIIGCRGFISAAEGA